MRKLITWKLLFTFAATIALQDLAMAKAGNVASPAGVKYSLAVLDLEGSGRVSSADAGDLTDRLREELRNAGIFQVMDKTALKSALSSRGLSMAGCSTKECALPLGRAAGAKLVANGSVSKVGPMYMIQLQLIHVKSGEVVESVREDFTGEFEALQAHMAIVARKLSGKTDGGETRAAAAPSTGNEETMIEAMPGASAENPPSDSFDYQSEPEMNRSSKGGGNKALVIGLIAVGAIGGGFLISQALKKDDNGNNNNITPPPVGGNLPNPPTFP